MPPKGGMGIWRFCHEYRKRLLEIEVVLTAAVDERTTKERDTYRMELISGSRETCVAGIPLMENFSPAESEK